MSAGHDPAAAVAHVRFAPKATEMLRHGEWTRCANRDLAHCSKKHHYSVTSSAFTERNVMECRAATSLIPA
jgi:hypothetical protein